MLKMLCISGYPAWEKVSLGEMPSHHLYGVHELIDHYENHGNSVRGLLKDSVSPGGYADFYLWQGGKTNIFRQTLELLRLSKEYDVFYDMLNRCSIFLGAFKRIGLFKAKLITVMHHPPYTIQLNITDSDAYIFFDEDYKQIATKANSSKKSCYFVNEWRPDVNWYTTAVTDEETKTLKEYFFIDNGKSRRDRQLLIEAAERAEIRVDYAGDSDESTGWARSYKVDLKDDLAQLKKLKKYKAIIIPISAANKERIGPLGITSYLDAVALGIPVIASDNACFAEKIKTINNGLIYKTGDSLDLENAIKRLHSNDDLYQTLCANMTAERRLDIKDYSNKLLTIIQR